MKSYRVMMLALLFLWTGSAQVDAQRAEKLAFFESKIRPVLVQHCYRCHSEESGKSKGGLQLDSQAGWQSGGDSGATIVPGKPEESLLFAAVSRSGGASEMPPSAHLPPNVISDFRTWIAEGAVDPRGGEAMLRSTEAIDIEAGRSFWAFQPRRAFTAEQSIDGFVGPQSLTAPAEKLVRRLFLDLIGLPPAPHERIEFVRLYNQQSPAKAIEKFADRLLARNEFGEKWARHWLDVVRYADSNGGDFNLTFHESWRYRNYVIDAFNQDLPYDQFLREQIAGDLLSWDTIEQRNRQLIATGFLMIAPKMLTERNKEKMRLDIADEQVDTIGRAIMGMTLGCARCHDHKFDPIPTADYYAMTGILHSTQIADRMVMDNVNITGWTDTDLAVDRETHALIDKYISDAKQLAREIELQKKVVQRNPIGIIVDDTEATKEGPWRTSTLQPSFIGEHYLANNNGEGPYGITWKATLPKSGKYELRVSFCSGSTRAKRVSYLVRHINGETKLTVNQTVKPSIDGLWHVLGQFRFGSSEGSSLVQAEVQLTDKDAGGHVIADAIQLIHVDDLEENSKKSKPSPVNKLRELQGRLKVLNANTPQIPRAMAAQDYLGERVGDLNIRIRGEARNLGRKIPRGFLQVACAPGSKIATIVDSQSGRVELAEWITHLNHPLTARVMTNRVWQHLFGRGIVATSDNFGVRGARPSHPELLDYLAGRFVVNDWSMKSLIREVVCSKTYQQAVVTASESDPDNLLLHHQNRRPVPAESMRDSILMIAGELDPEPRESVVAEFGMFSIETNGRRHKSLEETGKLRQRSIYMPMVRGAVPPSLAIFDMSNPNMVTGTRAVTNVPAQALFMMNSPFVRDMAQTVGLKTAARNLTLEATIKHLYQRILVRDASPDDVALGKRYLTQLGQTGKSQSESIASFVQVLFSSAEFRFVE